MSNVIIEKTPFIFEDGNTYYFEVFNRNSNVYHGLFVYKKVVTKKSFLFWNWEVISYEKINDKESLVGLELKTSDIKKQIILILNLDKKSKLADHRLKDWDGFVGDVPDEVKKSLKRDSKLNDLLG